MAGRVSNKMKIFLSRWKTGIKSDVIINYTKKSEFYYIWLPF